MLSDHSISRRQLARIAAMAGLVATGTGYRSAWAQTPTVAPVSEAPSLAEQVDAGTLPPLAERLPAEPLVVTPQERVGVYGGNWRMGLVGGGDTQLLNRTIGYEPLLRWDLAWENVIPNLATAVEVSEDARIYTFTLRTGVKWSDGAPFTAEDIAFYVNDVRANVDLGGGGGSNKASADVIDDGRISISFESPNGLFLTEIAGPNGDVWTAFPRHYLEQFHATYNTTNLDELVAQEGASGWVELFQRKGSNVPGTAINARWSNPEMPTIYAWQIVEPYSDAARVTAVRNPYYWKIDTAGNQLPYIETISYNVLQEAEVLLLQAASGEIDMQYRNLATSVNKPVLADAMEAGNFRFYETVSSYANANCIHLNLCHKDPVKREVFASKDFRIGLSHAINRQEIIDVMFVGQTEAWQNAPHRDTPFYNEQLATQYLAFDPNLAREHIARVLPNQDDEGFFLDASGSRFSFLLDVVPGENNDITNLVVNHWRAVGIEVAANVMDRSFFEERRVVNDHDSTVFYAAGGIDVIENPPQFLPIANRADYAQPWVTWYLKPSNPDVTPEDPPEIVQQQMTMYDELRSTADRETQIDLMNRIIQIAADEFYNIGVCLPPRGYGVQKNTFFNVPPVIFDSFTWLSPAPANPSQFFIEGEA